MQQVLPGGGPTDLQVTVGSLGTPSEALERWGEPSLELWFDFCFCGPLFQQPHGQVSLGGLGCPAGKHRGTAGCHEVGPRSCGEVGSSWSHVSMTCHVSTALLSMS